MGSKPPPPSHVSRTHGGPTYGVSVPHAPREGWGRSKRVPSAIFGLLLIYNMDQGDQR